MAPHPELLKERGTTFIEVTNHHSNVYFAAAEGAFMTARAAKYGTPHSGHLTVADIGAGNSPFYHDAALQDMTVTRIDPVYDHFPPFMGEYVVGDARDLHEISDNSYDVAISCFLMQHLQREHPGDVTNALMEMMRIVKPATEGGIAVVYPVYGPKKLKRALFAAGIDDSAIWFPRVDDETLADHGFPLRALALQKVPGMNRNIRALIARTTEQSGALGRRETIGAKIRDLRMRHSGDPRFNVQRAHH